MGGFAQTPASAIVDLLDSDDDNENNNNENDIVVDAAVGGDEKDAPKDAQKGLSRSERLDALLRSQLYNGGNPAASSSSSSSSSTGLVGVKAEVDERPPPTPPRGVKRGFGAMD